MANPPQGQPRTEDDESVLMLGVPLPTQLYGLLVASRSLWLTPEDGHGMVLNQRLAEDVGVGGGDWVTIHYPISASATGRWSAGF